MQDYLAANFNLETVKSQIDDESSIFLLGFDGGELTGYAMLKEGVPPDSVSGEAPIELVRFYVIEQAIGMGYGSQLMQACLEEAKRIGRATLWLGVWEKNERAIRFYVKWGFRKVGVKKFMLGRDEQDDLIMARAV